MRRLALLLTCVVAAALPAALPTRPALAGPPAVADKWALLVGVNAYRGKVQKTIGSVGDVADVRQLLIANGWASDHILVLTDDNATAARIREGFRWLAGHSSDASYSVFHYSGHVKQMTGDLDRDGEDKDEFLWPVDNNYISDGEFGAAMRAVKGWAWVNVSGCEAAGFNEGVASPKRLFTASSNEPEKSYEQPSWKNSVHTGYMVDYGMLRGEADANHDGALSITEGFRFSERLAPQMTAKQAKGAQHPYMSGGDGSEWFLAPPPPVRQQPQQPKSQPQPGDDGRDQSTPAEDRNALVCASDYCVYP
ncbi:MAG TPA: caspase family protein [Acidimicrobiales bacterium]|nr:caspase family protein [Acidimicrobiales bacterium]